MRAILVCVAGLLLAACAGTEPRPATVERMYVIDCGENQTQDLSRWTPGENVGRPWVFGDHCYLVKHAQGYLLWDSGNPDRLAALPDGLTNPQGTITAFMRKPLAQSLLELGLKPTDITYFAMSHSHGDHSGNANLFAGSTIFMQRAEYDAVFGPEPQKYGFAAANFEKLKGAKIVVLDGERDVFGDGSVVIEPTPGHTPGHQSLLVRLKRTGPVLLTGDLVHLRYSWDHDIVPGFNFDVKQSHESIARMKALVAETHAQVWVNHDREQHTGIPQAPGFVD
jgi:glyoxylase-like metal-dependent hydrolase (beta-lactamase superfamily II)